MRQLGFGRIVAGILEVVPGGILRSGKVNYSDTDTGFWLGVDTDGLAKFNLGGSGYYMRWTGTVLELGFGSSALTLGSDGLDLDVPGAYQKASAITWQTGEDEISELYVIKLDYVPDVETILWAHDLSGYSTLLDLVAEATGTDLATARLRATAPGHSAHVFVEASSSGDKVVISGDTVSLSTVDMSNTYRITRLADATAATDALNRQTGDGRYLQQSDGVTGSFVDNDGNTVTVVDGQITALT